MNIVYPIRGQILRPVTRFEPSPGLSEYVLRISLASKNSGSSWTKKKDYCWRIRFYVFSRASSQEHV